MKNLFIPPLGSEITLAQDWTFELYRESRNYTLTSHLKLKWPEADYYEQRNQHQTVTIPSGEKLKIDRIYIRKGQGDFDSVTFFWKGKALPSFVETYRDGSIGKVPKQAVRFWAKLEDVNKIMIEDQDRSGGD